MTAEKFDELLDLIKIDIQGDDTTLREAIPASLKLQSWTKYIETTTKIQVELMNPQLRLRIGIF